MDSITSDHAPPDPGYRSPPQNIEAEQALLGAMLVNPSIHQQVEEYLLPEHFFHPAHVKIYAAIDRLLRNGHIADPVTLRNLFEHDGTLSEVNGAGYLARLAASVVTIINAGDYGRTIYDNFVRRQIIEIGTAAVNASYEHTLETESKDILESTERQLFELATKGNAEGKFQPFTEALKRSVAIAEKAFQRGGKTSGLSTGFRDLDLKLGGLHPSDLIILAGRPSMGKTALATNIAFNVAKLYREGRSALNKRIALEGGVVGFFSLEMSAEQLAGRVLAEESGVSGDKIRRGEVDRSEFERFVAAATRLQSVALHIDDTPALTIGALRTRARRLQREHGLDLIVLDYLQLLQGSQRAGSEQNRVQELSEITRGLKALAKELSVPVLALSQLSRAVEQREDKRPQLADLRESGSIEQDADVVMFVFREEYYLNRATPMQRPDEAPEKFNQRLEDYKKQCERVYGLAELIIGKQRHGPIGTVPLTFQGEITKFSDYVGRDHLPEQMY